MKTRELILISLFATLTAISSQFQIPFGSVPITLQSLIPLLAGIILGAESGTMSQIIYLLLGFCGLPVFAGGTGGIGYVFGPTGGYIIGFIACSYVTGIIAGRRKSFNFIRLSTAMICGTLAIHILGVTWLAISLHVSIKKALLIGLLPFIPGDIIKIAACFGIIKTLYSADFFRIQLSSRTDIDYH